MAFMEALPAVEEAAGGGGRLSNLFRGAKDGQGKQSTENAGEPDTMSAIAQEAKGPLNG